MTSHFHPLVLAHLQLETARAVVRLETVRSRRNQIPGLPGHSDTAIQLGKEVAELNRIVAGWQAVLSAVEGDILAFEERIIPQ